MKFIITFISLLMLSTCEKEASQENTTAATEAAEIKQEPRITKKEIAAIDFLDYGLSNPTEKAVDGWANFEELENLVESIKNGDLSYFEGDKVVLSAFIKELKSELPEKVSSQSVSARLTAVETKFYKLKSAVTITKTPKAELVSAITEFFQACSNLNLQMNKKLEKDTQNIFKSNL